MIRARRPSQPRRDTPPTPTARRRCRPSPAATARRRCTTRSPAPARATVARWRSCARPRWRPMRPAELPVWRRSGFWTTSLQTLDLRRSRRSPRRRRAGVPDVVTRTLPDRPRAGRIVQSAGSVVHVELDARSPSEGVILCSLEDAFREHAELVAPWYSQAPDDRPPQARGRQRRVLDRRRVPARARGTGRGGPV